MLNDDIIRVICAEITDTYGIPVPKDLLSLGLASRIFLDPVLDVMWKDINGIERLLSVLPETTLVNGKKMFLRPIAPSSWDRLHFYTSRVRKFAIRGPAADEVNVHDSVYAYLGQKIPIFPKLTTLRLTHQLCSSNTYTLFLTTSLQVVSWPSRSPEADPSFDLGPSLAFLVSKSPELRSLTLDKCTYSGLSPSLRRLCALEYLSTLNLSHLDVDFIRAIAFLPKLTELSLTLPAGIALDYTGVESGFPSLTKIALWGSISDTQKFLVAARPKALQDLSISWDGPAIDWSFRADMTAITRFLPSLSFLQDLVITEPWVSSSLLTDLDEQQLWSIFEPLLELKQLESLDYRIPLRISDQRTVRIACAWPHLKNLYLYSATASGPSFLKSLAHFARHCPVLENLYYPIELQTTTPTTIIQTPTLSTHPLHRLRCNMGIDRMAAGAIAQALHQIFPNLNDVDGPGGGWREVQGHLTQYIMLDLVSGRRLS
ncbi:hypothetical protein BDP27DRAFT_1450002 [Rhodocollybia butyracea]|uniref:F-box domain-containing protein n=1 Tax=Rhodocollybia butyracea TaxID=206335 RepID=A0A9P5PMB3_9AGAR|nr:hypothetical protein BDP27DRAFT_1450002 [Rhodocollybia butyracea]